MRRRKDVGILPVPFDLSSSCKPVAKTDGRCSRLPQIPAVYEAVNCASGEYVRMMRREVDISDSSVVAMKSVFDCSAPTLRCDIPYDGLLIGGAHNPIVAGGEGRPLNIRNLPGCVVFEMPRRGIRGIEINDMESFATFTRLVGIIWIVL